MNVTSREGEGKGSLAARGEGAIVPNRERGKAIFFLSLKRNRSTIRGRKKRGFHAIFWPSEKKERHLISTFFFEERCLRPCHLFGKKNGQPSTKKGGRKTKCANERTSTSTSILRGFA